MKLSRSRVCNVWNQWLMIKMWFCNSIPPTDGPTSFFPNLGQRCSSCSVGIWSAFGCTSGSIRYYSKRVFKNVIWNIVLIYVDLIWNELTYGQRCLPWWSLSFLSLPNKTESRMLQSFKTSVSWARDDLRPTRFKTCYIIDSCYNIAIMKDQCWIIKDYFCRGIRVGISFLFHQQDHSQFFQARLYPSMSHQ